MLGVDWCCRVEERLVDMWRKRVYGGREGREGWGRGESHF
jgi:hypothetical protein